MSDGHSLAWHLYPPYPFKGGRKRIYSHIVPFPKDGTVMILDEDGTSVSLPDDASLYENLKSYARHGGRTMFTRQLNIGRSNTRLISRAARDSSAQVSYCPKGGMRGIRWKRSGKRGEKSGAIIVRSAWNLEEPDPMEYIQAVRRMSELLGVGDYDTSGSAGQATLSKFWTERGLRRVWRLPERVSDALNRYSIGGRAEVKGVPGMVYPSACELDLSSAYPTAVSRGLPAGELVYHSSLDDTTEKAALYGLWRIRVHGDIELSPLPVRNWEYNGELVWRLAEGMEFEYGGWRPEIDSLLETGRASADFIRGWSWSRLDTLLAPWVDELVEKRLEAEYHHDERVAKLIKHVTNSAIGRWGMDDKQWELVPQGEEDIDAGDLPLEYPRSRLTYGDPMFTGVWVRQVLNQSRNTLPFHWNSYVKMAVRMELYDRMKEEIRQGGRIISVNFDSILLENIPKAKIPQPVEEHPWHWKEKVLEDVEVPFNRGIVFSVDGIQQASLPGITAERKLDYLESLRLEA